MPAEPGDDSSRRDLLIELSYLYIGQVVDELRCETSRIGKPQGPAGGGRKPKATRWAGLGPVLIKLEFSSTKQGILRRPGGSKSPPERAGGHSELA